MLRVIIINLLIVAMAMVATGSDDYADDIRFDYFRDWIAQVQGNLNKVVVKLRGDLATERKARTELERNLAELQSKLNLSSKCLVLIQYGSCNLATFGIFSKLAKFRTNCHLKNIFIDELVKTIIDNENVDFSYVIFLIQLVVLKTLPLFRHLEEHTTKLLATNCESTIM